ncbi:hypothetical protein NQ176_g7138 [Zarea fungicola]|uniref:Uncharacterized protein n=1 Tax=Zarea fungicola TaxID=93591 RepID=A0ACC1N1H1_9HYPO|nr:hypothetical protein NQ176_g7138 [Lecanicillium fungicola]
MTVESGIVSIANKGKASIWTEEAKYELLLRIIHHLKQNKTINWSRIKMKDRTTKSMTNVWTKINKDIAELDDLDDGTGSAITTPKKGNATKRKPTAQGDDGHEEPETPPRKKGRATSVKKSKNTTVKTEEQVYGSADEF